MESGGKYNRVTFDRVSMSEVDVGLTRVCLLFGIAGETK